MSFDAVDAVDDAFDAVRSFLWPFELGRWARLAVVVFFLGGASSGGGSFANPAQFTGGVPGDGAGAPASPSLPSLGSPELAAIAVLVGILLVLSLAFGLVGAIMEFVLVASLRREEVTIRRYWGQYWDRGLRLFGFRLAVGLLTLGAFALLALALFWPVLSGTGDFSLGTLLAAIPVAIAVAIVGGLVNGFTTAFVAPIMLLEDRGVLSAWRRFWPTLTDQWTEYLMYVIMSFVLRIAAGIAAGLATLIGALLVAIPLGIVAAVGFVMVDAVGVVGWSLVAIAAVLFVLALLLLVLFTAVPVRTFLRYYDLLVLGGTTDAFDLVSQLREPAEE